MDIESGETVTVLDEDEEMYRVDYGDGSPEFIKKDKVKLL